MSVDVTISPGSSTSSCRTHFDAVSIFHCTGLQMEGDKAGAGKLDPATYRRRRQNREGKGTLRKEADPRRV